MSFAQVRLRWSFCFLLQLIESILLRDLSLSNQALLFGARLFVGKGKTFRTFKTVTLDYMRCRFRLNTQQLLHIVYILIYRLSEWWLLTVCDQEARFALLCVRWCWGCRPNQNSLWR